jgi:hypothetical protein
MMPTSPSPPLKFRTAGFPQYGFKASLSGRAFPAARAVKPLPASAPPRSVCIDPSPASATDALAWLSVQAWPCFREPLCERPRAALPQGPLAPVRVLLSRSIVAYYDPIRRSRRHAATSRPCRLYAAPSLCGSASATHETFPTFPAVLSARAVDLTPVGPRSPTRCARAAIPGFLVLSASRHPRAPVSASNSRRGCPFRRCIVRVMLRPARLPGPPGWLRHGGTSTVPAEAPCHSRFWRRPSPGRRWESG